MAEDRMALLEMLRRATADGDTDFLRELTGLAKGERDPEPRPGT